jgi:uncharacterized protein YggE
MLLNEIQKKRLVGGVIAFLAVVSVYFVVKLINEIRAGEYIGTKDTPSTITISGDSEVFAAPDIAMLSFTARGEGSTTKIAQDKETVVINKAVKYLKDKGIADKDIKTSNYYLQPNYEYPKCTTSFCASTPRISGYSASQTVEVKIRDLDMVGDLLTGLGDQGVTEISGPNFTIEDEDKLKDEAREAAIDEAREKAEKLARDLGVDIVRVTSFQESGNGYYPMPYAKDMLQSEASSTVSNPVIPTGENKISVTVTITYEIR